MQKEKNFQNIQLVARSKGKEVVILLCKAPNRSRTLMSTQSIYTGNFFLKTKQFQKTNSLCRPSTVRVDTNTSLQPLAERAAAAAKMPLNEKMQNQL